MTMKANNNRDFFRLSTLLLGSTMTVMAGATIAPALPQIDAFFQAAPHAKLLVKMLLSVHALFIALSAPMIGVLMDRYGRKPVLACSLILYGLAGTSGYYLGSLYGIMLGRAFLGISVAGIMSGFTTLIGDYFSGERLHKVMGLQAAFTGFGGLLFVSTGGFLADFGWRYPFLIYSFAFLIFPGVIAFLYEPSLGADTGRKGPAGDDKAPAVSLKLVASIYLLAFFGMLVFYLIPVQLPFYLKSMSGVSNAMVGISLGMINLIGALSSMQFKKIRQKFSHRGIYMLFALAMGVGYLCIFLGRSYGFSFAGLMVAGMGFGLLMPNVNVWLVSFVPASVRGKFVGGLTTSFLLGQFVFPPAGRTPGQKNRRRALVWAGGRPTDRRGRRFSVSFAPGGTRVRLFFGAA